MSTLLKAIRIVGPAVLVALLVASIWQGIIYWFDYPSFLLPGPCRVAKAIFAASELLSKAFLTTLATSIVSLLVALFVGVLLAILFSQSTILRVACYPYVIFLQTVPIVAIAPLLIIWSGSGPRTVVLIALIISVFPIISNTTAGLLAIDRNHRDLFRLYGAGRWATLWRLQIPTAVAYLALGMKISCGLAVIGTIVGEYFVSTGQAGYVGLGSLMSSWQTQGKTDGLFAIVFASTLLGLIIFGSVNLLTRTVLKRWVNLA